MKDASAIELDYYLFCGSVVFQVNGARFDADWNWVPILHFAVGLRAATESLMKENSATVDFTESEAHIDFVRIHGDRIRISASYSQDEVIVTHPELRVAVESFCQKLMTHLCADFPDLLENPAFVERQASLLRAGP